MENLSVCMPYYNRRDELKRSIRAYERLYGEKCKSSGVDLHLELSIVDDRSRPSLVMPETTLDVTFSCIQSKDHKPKNPCVPMNQAVNQSKHDIIVLTNPEIEHTGDVFGAMLEKLGRFSYVTAKCVQPGGFIEVPRQRDHDIPENSGFHFCAMLTRELWDRAGGFDENFRDGSGHEDIDWLYTLKSVGTDFVMVNETVLHHPTDIPWARLGHGRNRRYLREKWNL
jgi:hypothetical protein